MNATAPLVLTETEVQTLEIWARMAASPRLALRARIVLAAASGSRNREIADQLCVSPKTVALWRRRFLNARLSGIEKEAPRGRRVAGVPEHIVRNILDATYGRPPDRRFWTTRALADILGVSPSTVHRVWKAHGISPGDARRIHEQNSTN
jgi:transposase